MNKKGTYIGIGIVIGTLIGIFTDNVGLWLSLGIVFGTSLEQYYNS